MQIHSSVFRTLQKHAFELFDRIKTNEFTKAHEPFIGVRDQDMPFGLAIRIGYDWLTLSFRYSYQRKAMLFETFIVHDPLRDAPLTPPRHIKELDFVLDYDGNVIWLDPSMSDVTGVFVRNYLGAACEYLSLFERN